MDFTYEGTFAEWVNFSNKCNCLVASAIRIAGASADGVLFNRPPTAGEWARGSNLPPNFSLVPAGDAAMRGDVVAQARDYRGATGHTAIMTSSSDLIHATGSIGLQRTTLTRTFPANYPSATTPVRFIRYNGTPNPWIL